MGSLSDNRAKRKRLESFGVADTVAYIINVDVITLRCATISGSLKSVRECERSLGERRLSERRSTDQLIENEQNPKN